MQKGAASSRHESHVSSTDQRTRPSALSLMILMLDALGAMLPLWWKEHMISHALHPWHFVTSLLIFRDGPCLALIRFP